MEARANLSITRPKIILSDDKLAGSTEKAPFLFEAQEVFMGKSFDVKLDPAPRESCKLEIRHNDGKAASIPVESGKASFSLDDLGVKLDGNAPIKLSLALPLPPTREQATKECWLEIPSKPSIWAEYMGEKLGGSEVTLNQTLDLTLKASHAGMDGYDWIETSAKSLDDPTHEAIKFDDANNLNFDDFKPGKYLVTTKFGLKKDPVPGEFTVVILSRTPWMLIALGTMAVLSISLFAWHFFRRRFSQDSHG
jgi:hypothetical protein